MKKDVIARDTRIRDVSERMRVQGIIVEDPLVVSSDDYETAILDPKVKNSVYSLSEGSLRSAVARISKAILALSPKALEKRACADVTMMKLKFSFWEEYCRCQDKQVPIDINNVVRGVCSKEYWIKEIESHPIRMAFVVIPPADGLRLFKFLMWKGFEKLNAILELPLEKQQSVTVREPFVPDLRKKINALPRGRPKKRTEMTLEELAEGQRTDEDKIFSNGPLRYKTTTKTTYQVDATAISEIRKTVAYIERAVRGEIRHMIKIIDRGKAVGKIEQRGGVNKPEPEKEYSTFDVDDVEDAISEMDEEIEEIEDVVGEDDALADTDEGGEDERVEVAPQVPKKTAGRPRKHIPESKEQFLSDEDEWGDL